MSYIAVYQIREMPTKEIVRYLSDIGLKFDIKLMTTPIISYSGNISNFMSKKDVTITASSKEQEIILLLTVNSDIILLCREDID